MALNETEGMGNMVMPVSPMTVATTVASVVSAVTDGGFFYFSSFLEMVDGVMVSAVSAADLITTFIRG